MYTIKTSFIQLWGVYFNVVFSLNQGSGENVKTTPESQLKMNTNCVVDSCTGVNPPDSLERIGNQNNHYDIIN